MSFKKLIIKKIQVSLKINNIITWNVEIKQINSNRIKNSFVKYIKVIFYFNFRKLFQDSDLKNDLDPYVSDAFISSIKGFTSE